MTEASLHPAPDVPGPLVTVVMPTFNRRSCLPRAIRSVQEQAYGNWELVVVDDRSTDGTRDLIAEYSRSDPRVRYLANDHAKGPSGARNCGIASARGKYLAFLDSDDEWAPEHLAEAVAVLETRGVQVTFSLWYESHSGQFHPSDQLGRRGERLQKAITELGLRVDGPLVFSGRKFFEYNLRQMVYCYHINTMVFDRAILATTGVFSERLRACEDIDFTYRVMLHYEFCLMRRYHYFYSEGTDNLYLFMDRSKADLRALRDDRDAVERLTFHGRYRIYMLRLRRALVVAAPGLIDRDACLEQIGATIGKKSFALGYLNSRLHPLRALRHYLRSLGCAFGRAHLKYALETLLFPGHAVAPTEPGLIDLT